MSPTGDTFLELPAWLPREVARTHRVVPCELEGEEAALLAHDASEFALQDRAADLGFLLGRSVRLVPTDKSVIESRLARYGELAGLATAARAGSATESARRHGISAGERESDVVARVAGFLADGVRRRASDIHFEPFDREFNIRYRIDGVLQDVAVATPEDGMAVHSRLKVMAGLDIAERRVAQDGRIRQVVDGREIDFRISTLPTLFGESVVLRVLDAAAVRLELAQLGMSVEVLTAMRQLLRRPHGIFIVTGPTGSGKTTTLYSCLRALNASDVKILTAEDPVEYELEGVMQVAVNPAAGLTFATALRSFLRQDPDVIMVGEIRDLETARIAVQAALTGHLVLTTLHTNDAAGAVTRLLDMGVEPFLLAATLEGVLAQRLVRRRCEHCAKSDATSARHCPECLGSGFHGRLGLYELLCVNEELRDLLTLRESIDRIREAACRCGLRSLSDAAARAVEAGLTTREEVLKHI